MDDDRKLMKNKLKLMLTNGFLNSTKNIPSQYGIKLDRYSEKFRGEGNALYMDQNHDSYKHKKILTFYNQSIAFAPGNSEALAKAYANKSALLRHVCKYAECTSEIDKALKITQSSSLKIKLFCRKAECLTALNSPENLKNLEKARFLLNKLEEPQKVINSLQKLITKTETIINEKKLNIPKKDKKREQIINLVEAAGKIDTSNFVEVKYSEKFGMHLIAARDFKPGEIIIVEKPHCMLASAIYDQSYVYCGYCTQYMWTCIPCDHCTWCLFCSEECKNQAWKEYHDIECDVMAGILALRRFVPFPVPQLTLRIFLRALRQAGSIVQLQIDLKTLDTREDYKSFCINGEVEDYKRFYSLREGASPEELNLYSQIMPIILVMLAKHSSIFGKKYEYHQIEKLMKNEEAMTVGALLMTTCKIACASGQGLFTSVYSVYKFAPKPVRQKAYRKRFGCDCECEACTNDWTEKFLESKETENCTVRSDRLMQKFLAAELSPAMERNREIATLFQMKDVVEEAWKCYKLPSRTLIFAVKNLIDIANTVYAESRSSAMPNECAK